MSGSRDIDQGPSDKEGKMTENPEANKEEKEKETNVSQDQNPSPSSSNPSSSSGAAAGVEIDVSDLLKLATAATGEEENVAAAHDQTPSDVNRESPQSRETTGSFKRPRELQPQGSPPRPDEDPDEEEEVEEDDSDSDSDLEEPELLFEVVLTLTDKLVIPAIAAPYLPREEETLQLTETKEIREWYFPISYDAEEKVFVIRKGWSDFCSRYNLRPMDLVRFYKPHWQLHTHHFLIEYDCSGDCVQEFRPENFLFRLWLTLADVELGRLSISRDDFTAYFPGIKLLEERAWLERRRIKTRQRSDTIEFTDNRNRNWKMMVVYSPKMAAFLVMTGWHLFVREHGLVAGDVIKFYKPVRPSHEKHFLIDYVKRDALTGGGGDKKADGGGAGPSGGGGSYKGKEKVAD